MATDLMATCKSSDITISNIMKIFENKQKSDEICYRKSNGNKCANNDAQIAYFDTGHINKERESIYGFFKKNKRGWKGIEFHTLDTISEIYDTFECGDIKFKPFSLAESFFDNLSDVAIPEIWSYKEHKSAIKHPVLKSFIENTFYRLIQEQKNGAKKIIVNNTHLLFNTGLLDKFFHDIYIVAELSQPDSFVCYNPIITSSLAKLKKFGGFSLDGKPINKEAMMPKKAAFFKEFHEVVFNIIWDIDKDFDKFEHIIEENRDRFPQKYAAASSDELARKVDNAIDDAKLMAERNYKFIVPQYRPTENKIQFLMPLYLDGKFNEAPDLALVLNLVEDLYVPETVLYLDAAYQNARLIAKPDNQWLDPQKIQSLEK